MAMMTACFDESGDPDTHAVVVAGFAATVDQWVRFDDDWKRAHSDFGLPDPAEQPFHMKDYAHSLNAFSGWKGDASRRRNFIARLINVIHIRVEYGFSFVLEMPVYEKVNTVYPLRELSTAPYALCASGCMFRSARWATDRGHRLEHVFADGARDKGKFLELIGPRVGPPIFGSMKKYLPCQAADLAAYECLKFTKDRDAYIARDKELRKTASALFGNVLGDYVIADEPSLRDICDMAGIPKRGSSAL